MKLFTWISLFLIILVAPMMAQTAAGSTQGTQPTITTSEAQAIYSAYDQTTKHVWSQYMLAMEQMVIALGVFCFLINLRSVAYVFVIFYAVLVLNTPYYIPTNFQQIFGCALLIMGVIGLLVRLLAFGKPKATPAQQPPSVS